MEIKSFSLEFQANHYFQFIDITDSVKEKVISSKIKNGLVLVFSRHTTAAIRINESESGFKKDFIDVMEHVCPKEKYYRHDDLTIRTENLVCNPEENECLNGHSHCKQLFLATSEVIPLINGELKLGKWQRIFLIELDKPRKREVIVQILGE